MILYDQANGVARITLNRPEKRNALSPDLITAIREALARSASSEEVRVVRIEGAGRDFCSGADLAGLNRESGVLENLETARHLADLILAARNHPRPVVAVVKGRALAGGCGLATACDVILAAESAQFGYPEVNIGFIPAMVMAILRRSVSEKRAFELIAMGTVIEARRAEEIGMINRVWSDSDFDQGADEYIGALAAKSRSALSLSKNLLYHMDGMTFAAALEAGVQANALARMTEDARRGIERFVKKG